MAKKSKKIEKETRKLIEAITDLTKKKGNRYKFRTKDKKTVKEYKLICPHWRYKKPDSREDEVPAVVRHPIHNDYWQCKICGATWPVNPGEPEDYEKAVDDVLECINQIQFWAVKMGGDAEDTRMFIKLRKNLPRFKKVSRQVLKRVHKRAQWEENRKKTDALAQFDAFSSFNFRH